MNERDLRKRLETTPLPGELEARQRSWRVVRAAYEEAKHELRPPRRWSARPLVALAAALALVAAAVSAPGDAVTTWLRETIGVERIEGGGAEARPALTSLPGGGRLLVTSRQGLWVVWPNGSRRRLGAYDDGTWSPRGLFVAATGGRQLVALEPNGKVRWILSRSRPVGEPRWSPSGYRIAYRSGSALRVVHGNGASDRLITGAAVPGAWAWRPGDEHVLAYADERGRVHVLNTDTGRTLRVVHSPEARKLEWSTDAARLVVAGAFETAMFDAAARLRRKFGREGVRFVATAIAPRGHRVAYVRFAPTPNRSTVVVMNLDTGVARALFTASGRFRDIAWSPDGRWLLVTWPSADQWVFLRVAGGRRIVGVSNISREFDPGRRGQAAFPRVLEWCCAP